jgi:hypothetical protein
MYRRGVTVAVLPPLAVLLAALPDVREHDTAWAVGAAVAQVFALITAIALIRKSRNPAQAWVTARTRAEVLRREQYLRLAQVGPYLNLTEVEARSLTAQRLALLDPTSDTPPESLIPARDPGGERWLDQIWARPPARGLPDLSERARCYLFFRIEKQRSWFERGARESRRSEQRIGRFIGWSLVLAIVIGLAHTFWLAAQPPWLHPDGTLAALLTLVLPPLAAALIALRELYTYRTRAASYIRMRDDLDAERAPLASLIGRIDAAAGDQTTLSREFQRFVLHLEATITVELQAWIMLTERDEFAIDL